ncbi:ATPase component of queuosine-regulated ECF transporter energizing module [Proteus hauseri ATCC 700826]|uniref:ATPase component of queuosine-regulated ECF transporter energizing module n=1 Tax=Proteus hauseri ATCC 700826 TaxID=1354271 RepID=A0AAJ3HS52_PROHU|nr:ATP-binding cassette domain-containing protein [Proteus hauseri]OAT46636.1 ATPase component of queuosine-regulated ECF transporter energizing module [Proteus hauseri ATCC 700826]
MLQLDKITYRWSEDESPCISQLSLTLNKGEWVTLVGDNGAGKSTLLRLAAGLLKPEQGTVRLNEQNLSHIKAAQRACQIGVLFQEPERQIFHSTVKDEILFGLKQRKIPKVEKEHLLNETLELCGLTDVANIHPLDLHAGQRRMVAVASLSIVSPQLLLLDEPTRDFDAYWLKKFEHWLNIQKKQGTSVLAISHDLDFSARHFRRIIHLSAGQLIADGAPEQVLINPTLQPPSVLPAPTLYSLSKRLGLPIKNNPTQWAEMLIARKSAL